MLEEEVCETCGEHVCIVLQFEADVISLRQWNARLTALETNRERRRMIFWTYHRWRWGGGGGRVQLERCVEVGVRSWFPDRFYMGFHACNDRTARHRAVDMFGNDVNAWWVFRDGAWVLEET